jgi:hypothetical protein
MAYPQAPIKMDIYMELPQGIQTKHKKFQGSRIEDGEKHVRPETGWMHMELIPHEQTHVHS